MRQTRQIHRTTAVFAFLLACIPTTGLALADGAPDLELNPVTGLIEAVAVSTAEGDRILHVEDPGQGGSPIDTVVSNDAAANSRIAIKPNGESWVVWQEDVSGEVRYAYRNPSTKVWTTEAVISNAGEASRNPSIVHNGLETWIAYEIQEGSATSIATTGIIDSPEPFPTRTIVGTTSFAGGRELSMHSESGHVWVTWIDGPMGASWSEYDHGTGLWSAPQPTSYDGTTAESARGAIRNLVLGL